MKVINFILAHWDIITLSAAAVVAVVFAIFKGNKSVVMKMLDALVTEAERAYGGGTGTLKLASVITEIYPKLPAIIKTFVSAKTLQKWVEDALKAAKKKWEENASIKAYIEPGALGGAENLSGQNSVG